MKPVRTPDTDTNYQLRGGTSANDLPCRRVERGLILSEWDLTKAERLALARGARIELAIYTEPIPPVSLTVVVRHADDDSLEYVDEWGPFGDPLTGAEVDYGATLEPLPLSPHSLIVARVPASTTPESAEMIAAQLRERIGPDRASLVVLGDIVLSTIEPSQLPIALAREVARAHDAELISSAMLKVYTENALELRAVRDALDAMRARSWWRKLLGLKPKDRTTDVLSDA